MIIIKESNLPDWQDTIINEIYNVLKNNRIYADVYEDYNFGSDDNFFVLCVEINNGDWKHEHRTADNVIVNFLDNYDNVEVTNLGEDITNEDGSDTYSSIHKYHIIRTDDNDLVDDDIASQQLDIKFANERMNRKSRKRIKESFDLDGYKFKFSKGDYKIYSKFDKDLNKGLWVAQKDGEEPFEISYEQARGFEPINPTDRVVQHKLKKALKMESVYTDNGYRNRADYLQSLADDYNVSITDVKALASLLGPEEDFDALVSEVEDLADEFDTNDEEPLTGLDWYLNEYNYVVISDGDFIVGFDKFEDAYEEVLQLLTRFNSNATLYDTFKNTKTAYKCGKIDYNKLNQFEYTEDEEEYYSYPYVLFVKEIGGSKAVDNIKKALKMAEVGYSYIEY